MKIRVMAGIDLESNDPYRLSDDAFRMMQLYDAAKNEGFEVDVYRDEDYQAIRVIVEGQHYRLLPLLEPYMDQGDDNGLHPFYAEVSDFGSSYEDDAEFDAVMEEVYEEWGPNGKSVIYALEEE